MHPLDPQTLRAVLLIAVVIVLYAGRMSKGSASETPEGLVFSIKPIVLGTRLIAIPLYIGIFLYPALAQHHQVPIWVPILLTAVVGFALYQLPGTIVLTQTAVIQRFWLRADKTILYPEVMTIQSIQAGRITRVLGDNRTTITHNTSLADAPRFRAELEARTNKKTTA